MWNVSENSEQTKPPALERSGNTVILRRNYSHVNATEEKPEHWEYEERQMTIGQYEIYQEGKKDAEDLGDAILELAELVAEVLDE